jgi:hypothetical protein
VSSFLEEGDFFEEKDFHFWPPFNVGVGVEICGALPHHRSCSAGPETNGAVVALCRIRNAQKTHKSSDEIGELFDWVSKGQPRFIHLIGHGTSGLIEVGDGQSVLTTGGSLHCYNSHHWAVPMKRTSKYDDNRSVKVPANDVLYSGGILLEACCVAEGEEGATFLKLLADTTLRTVFAYTGLISIRNNSSVWFEKGHAWLRQDPLSDKPTIEAKPLHSSLIRTGKLQIAGQKGMEAGELLSIEINYLLTRSKINFIKEQAKEILDELFYSKGFGLEGKVLGIITHQFTIRFQNQEDLHVDLYSKRLAKTDREISYLVGTRLIEILEGAIR